MKKINHFNYFNQEGKEQQKKQDTLKKVWKWIKIVLYTLLFGLTVTGCVQSFVLKNSSSVGNSIEFYSSKDEVSPRVNTFVVKDTKEQKINIKDNDNKDVTKDGKIQTVPYELATLSINPDINTLVNNPDILEKLKKQTSDSWSKDDTYTVKEPQKDGSIKEAHKEYPKPEYGEIKKYYTTFAIDDPKVIKNLGYDYDDKNKNVVANPDKNNISLIAKNRRFLFQASNSTRYKYTNDITNIYLLTFASKKDEQLVQVITHPETKDSKKQIPTVENGNYILVGLSGLQSVPKYTGLLTENTINLAFARDVLQTLYNFSFGPNSTFIANFNKYAVLPENKQKDKDVLKDYQSFSDYLEFLAKKLQGQSNPRIPISQAEKFYIDVYQATMTQYLTQLGFLHADDFKSFNKDTGKSTVFTEPTAATKYNPEQNILYDLGQRQNKDNKSEKRRDIDIPFKGVYPSQAITNWGEAWAYGPFYGFIVYPLSAITQGISKGIPDLKGWGSIIVIILALIITRLTMFGITFRSKMMQSVQDSLRPKKAAIEAKYVGFEKNKAMKMKKNQEIQALYSKYNISPLDQFGSILLTIPVFLAMWRVIQAIPQIKQTTWLGLNFASVSWTKILSGEFIYSWILILTIAIQVLSQLLPKLLNRKGVKQRNTIAEAQALKKSERTQKIMVIVFAVITVLFSVGVQVYWLFGGLWQIGEVLLLHRLKKTTWYKQKYESRLKKS
ncbi:membrane protein insertase YidC [Mycoplasma sp. 394]